MQSQSYQPLAALLANAQAAESAAAKLAYIAQFGKRLITTFPALYRHPELRVTRCVLVTLAQWSFALSGVEFLVQWHAGRGGYWTFMAWDDCHKLSERDSFAFSHPSADVALLAFVGDALAMAQREKVA